MTAFNPSIPPRLQSQLIGHKKPWEFFVQSFIQNKLHPAWLLAGAKGIGKATFAYQAARHILKAHQNNDQFFDNLINQKAHPNLLIIERETDEEGKLQNEINIEAVRKIANFVHQSAAFPGWRVVIIDAIDELNRNAANALLKILEEPPAKVLILLVCHTIGRVLPTIRSRCCLMPMAPPPPEEFASLLGRNPSPFAYELAGNSIGRLYELQQFDLSLLLSEAITGIKEVLENNISFVQSYIEKFEKADPRYVLMNDLLRWLAYQLVLIPHQPHKGQEYVSQIQMLGELRPVKHWLEVQENLTFLLDEAQGGHLDAAALLLATFLCFESPHLVIT